MKLDKLSKLTFQFQIMIHCNYKEENFKIYFLIYKKKLLNTIYKAFSPGKGINENYSLKIKVFEIFFFCDLK